MARRRAQRGGDGWALRLVKEKRTVEGRRGG